MLMLGPIMMVVLTLMMMVVAELVIMLVIKMIVLREMNMMIVIMLLIVVMIEVVIKVMAVVKMMLMTIMIMMIMIVKVMMLKANFCNLSLSEFPLFLIRIFHFWIHLDIDDLYEIARYFCKPNPDLSQSNTCLILLYRIFQKTIILPS